MHRFSNYKKLYKLSENIWDYASASGVHDQTYIPAEGGTIKRARDGHIAVNMSSYSYLGLDQDPRIVQAAQQSMLNVGVLNSSLSRVRLTLPELDKVEDQLSDLFNCDVVTTNSCASAVWATLPVLASGLLTGGKSPTIAFDKRAHFCMLSLQAACSDETEVLTIDHNDLDALERLCKTRTQVAYVCDSVYSTGGTVAPISDLARLQDRYGLFLYFDDAHSTSIAGSKGRGISLETLGGMNDKTLIVTSLNKGFGASGGAILLGPRGQNQARKYVQRTSGPLMWSQRINTAAIGAIRESTLIHQSAEISVLQKALQQNIEIFDRNVTAVGHGNSVPIRFFRIGSETTTIDASRILLDRGFYVEPDFFPIVSRGQAGLRIRIRATMTEQQITAFIKELDAVGVVSPITNDVKLHSASSGPNSAISN